MNPAISQQFLDKALKANRETFRREHLAEFVDSSFGWITSELLEPCVMRDRRQLPPVSNGTYVAAADPAFKSSDFGLAILHRSDRGDITVVCVLRWTGSKAVPLDFEIICQQIHGRLREYGINNLVGDQYCFAMLKQHFSKLGIFYREFSFGGRTRAELFGNLRQLIAQRKIAIVDDPELLRQLRSLEEIQASNGNVDIRPPRSSRDDMAVAVAVAALELSGTLPERFDPVVRGTVEAVITRRSSGSDYCTVGPNMCGQFPGCWDRGKICECYEC